MSNDKDFKVKNGVKPTVYHEAVGTVVSGSEGYRLASAVYDPPESLAWNLSTAAYVNKSFSVAAQETEPRGLFFKPDGTKMYVIGVTGDDVNEYNLSTPWDVSTASFLQLFSVAPEETIPTDVFFKPDGTKMYIVGSIGQDVNEYNLNTAWDISTASYLQNFSVAAQDGSPQDLFFKPDGTKMYVMGPIGRDVNEYDLSTAWDISSASFLQLFSVAAQETGPQGLFFKPDGTKMYVIGPSGDAVNEYNLSTPWDVSTASFLQLFSVAAQETLPSGLFFKPDGTVFYIIGPNTDTVYQYTLGGFSIAAQETSPQGISFKPDGTKMYVVGATGDDVNEYNLSTAWDTSTAAFNQLFSVSAQETAPVGLFFKPDGTKMYIVGNIGDSIYEYNLSTAWDISTASYVQGFSVSAQELTPSDVSFKPDGTKMYVVGSAGDDVNEYNLSTAWDISTASYLQTFSVAAQDAAPQDLVFNPDGTKMYVVGSGADAVYEYSLSTAWDISTASYLQTFSVAAQDTAPAGLFFKPDGSIMYIVGNSTDTVYQYSTVLNTATLDLSTGSVFEITPTSDIQVTLSNPAASGTVSGATLLLEAVGTAYTITYDPAIQWPGGTAPTAPDAGDTDVITFSTRNGGTTYSAALAIDGAS